MNELRISEPQYRALCDHLFRPDGDEHAAAITAGIQRTPGRMRLLAKELIPVPDEQFVSGEHGYRMITPGFLARVARDAESERLGLILVHNHPGADLEVGLSSDDLAGHRRGFPALIDILCGNPVLGLVLGRRSAAGEIWNAGAPEQLDHLVVLGDTWQMLNKSPGHPTSAEIRFDRQTRLFGADGQGRLRALHVAVIGAGGGGSLLVEALAHLGVGRITVVDYDRVAPHNLSRIVGSTPRDARRHAKKIDVARRMVSRVDSSIRVTAIDGDLSDPTVAEAVAECDAILIATDTHSSRLIANAIACAYLIPTIQIGAKVDQDTRGAISSVYSITRPVLPGRACLHCQHAIDPVAIQRESASAEERTAQAYVGDAEVIDPSVITLNSVGATAALNALLFASVGLGQEGLWQPRIHNALTGEWLTLQTRASPECPWCGANPASQYARGDAALLPLRLTPSRCPRGDASPVHGSAGGRSSAKPFRLMRSGAR
jgi:molybdopterin/thiamine biosynthesis adenylyltransferase